MKNIKKLTSIWVIAALSLAAIASLGVYSAKAADFVAPSGEDGLVTINRTETHHNLYVAGGDVSVNSPTTGDLYAAGGSVFIDGPVEQDVVVAGGNIVINEPVGGDLRVGGGKVTLNASVKGDVLVAGGSVVLTDKSSVGGELRVGGGSAVVNGPVSGGAFLMGDKITLNSKIDGPVKVTANKELVFGPSADIASEVSYIGKHNATVSEGAKVAGVSFTEMEQHKKDRGEKTGIIGFLIGGFIIKFFAVVLAGLLALRLFRPSIHTVTESMLSRPWGNLGMGFVAAIAVPVAIIISFIVIVGYYMAIIVAMAYILALLIAGLLSVIFLGAWVVKLLTKKTHLVLDWQALVLGTVLMMLLKFVPVVGWLVCAVIFLMAFGAMVNVFRQHLRRSREVIEQP